MHLAPRKAIDLGSMTLEELRALHERLELLIPAKKRTVAAALKTQIAAEARAAGFTVDELFDVVDDVSAVARVNSGEDARTAAVKYRNPKDPAQTWSGRGRRARWLTEALDSGAKLEYFIV